MRLPLVLGPVLAGLILMPSVVAAQAGPPDPASIKLPDLSSSSDPKVNDSGFRYHYLHKEGATFEQAFADFSACGQFISNGFASMTPVPGFTPWPDGRGKGSKLKPDYVTYGLVGGWIGEWAINRMDRDSRIGVLWRCMKPRGYLRYAIPEEIWALLNDPDKGGSLAMLAKAASSPTPGGEPVSQ